MKKNIPEQPDQRAGRFKIPPLLLEGDAPASPPPGGPGRRYELGTGVSTGASAGGGGELPESYGTRQLFLTARDPRWLYAHWDLSLAEMRHYNRLSADGHLLLRVYRDEAKGEPVADIHLHPESRHWFVPVPAAGAKYIGVLGYFNSARRWVALAQSGATMTPPDSLSEDASVRFATIPHDIPFKQLLAIVRKGLREHLPLAEAIGQLRAEGRTDLPGPDELFEGEWTADQELALSEVVSMDRARRLWLGSLEITELVRRQLGKEVAEVSSMEAAQFGQAELPIEGFPAFPEVSSPFGGMQKQRDFWFVVNAELIVYGATEPDAQVTIGGRPIKLRPDGSFSYRFAFPNGRHQLEATARSADGEEAREVFMEFSRNTTEQGEVGVHPQDESLSTPEAEAFV